ncbi:MAG: hypothetical protein K2G01_05520 [Paramuribaculum sp.]|nr:hypothetical protein [Paramuribaculum sp.]
MTEFNEMQLIKRRFFAMRNGVIADTLRKAGSPFRIIFGLNLPQIVEIAAAVGFNSDLGRSLWANTSTRESMLVAPMLMNPSDIGIDEAVGMCGECPSPEVADVLCHRLLRHLPFAWELSLHLAGDEREMCRYCAMRILWHYVYTRPAESGAVARLEIGRMSALTAGPARQIVEEVEFLAESEATNDASAN